MTQPSLLAYTNDETANPGLGRKFASAMLWWGVAFFALLVLSGCAGLLLPRVLLFGGPMLALLILISINAMIKRIRIHRAYVALAYLEQATRLNIALPQMLNAAARSERGLLAQRLALLAVCLQNGFQVAAALGRTMPEMPPEIVAEIEAGEAVGRLPQTIARLMDERRRQFQVSVDQSVFGFFYPLFIFIFASNVLLQFIMIVVPKFQEIFRDFGVGLPRSTQWLINLGDYLLFTWSASILSILAFIFITAVLGALIRRMFIAGEHQGLTRPLFDWLRWHLPLWGPIEREAELARVCGFLSEALEQGLPLPEALDAAERIPQNSAMRYRVGRLRAALLQGASLGDAVMRAEFPGTAVDLLAPAERAGSVPETFAFLARHYRWRTDRRRLLLTAALQPAMVLLIGCIVGFITVAIFSPLVQLIQRTTEMSGSL